MKTIVSKRRFSKFYLPLIAISFFYFALGSVLVLGAISSLIQDKPGDKSYLLLAAGLIFYICFIHNIYAYFKNAPIIKLNSKSISFNNNKYLVSEINNIFLSGKQPFKHIINLPMESTELLFKNKKSKYIFDDMYSNSWEIKSYLAEIFRKNEDDSPKYINYTPVDNNDSPLESFKGHHLLSFTGIYFWALAIFFIYILLIGKSNSLIFSCTIFLLLFLLLIHITSFMNYFQISDNHLIIKNHILIWNKKSYNMQNIQEIVFERNGNMPNVLRIITNDFKSKKFSASTLKNKNWFDFKLKLEEYNIKVRNESIY